MRKTTLLVISVFAAVLLSSTFFSVVAAQEETEIDEEPKLIAPQPDYPVGLDEPQKSAPDENATLSQDDEQIYPLYGDGREAANAPVPDAESEANLIAADTSAPDYTLPLAVVGVVLAVALGGAIGVISYRKREAKTET